jgi:hypothetical protein
LIVGRGHLADVLAEYVAHHNSHRPHRGLGLRRPQDVKSPDPRPRPGPSAPRDDHAPGDPRWADPRVPCPRGMNVPSIRGDDSLVHRPCSIERP